MNFSSSHGTLARFGEAVRGAERATRTGEDGTSQAALQRAVGSVGAGRAPPTASRRRRATGYGRTRMRRQPAGVPGSTMSSRPRCQLPGPVDAGVAMCCQARARPARRRWSRSSAGGRSGNAEATSAAIQSRTAAGRPAARRSPVRRTSAPASTSTALSMPGQQALAAQSTVPGPAPTVEQCSRREARQGLARAAMRWRANGGIGGGQPRCRDRR